MPLRAHARALRTLTLVVGLGALTLSSGCRKGAEEGADEVSSAAVEPTPDPEPKPPSPPPGARYARSLEAQLDFVPPDADGFLVVRDFRPLLGQARVVEALMAGPPRRAIPALAKLGGGTGAERLAQLANAEQLLGLVLMGIEGAGIVLESGAVLAQTSAGPLVVFEASDIDKLLALASMALGGSDLGDICRPIADAKGWHACGLYGPEAIAAYRPAGQGEALTQRLRERVGFDALEGINVAVSVARGAQPVDAVLRTDPDLWELSGPLAGAGMEELERELPLVPGPPGALAALVPGTSFAWARVEPKRLGGELPGLEGLDTSLLSGELFFGVHDTPVGLVARMGTTDEAKAIAGVEAMTKLVPDDELVPEDLPDLRLSFDRARLDLGGRSLPSIGISAAGPTAETWAASLGVDPRARLWVEGDYLSLALGKAQAIPGALAKTPGSGPSSAALATLPSTLGEALVAGEVGFVTHIVLDHWQAPPSTEELETLLAGLGPEAQPAAASIFAAFEVLAPWSSVDLWLRRVSPDARWSLSLSLVPFAAPRDGVGADEQAAAEAALSSALAGAGQAAYRELASRFPNSVQSTAYRARTGDAPDHHAAIGMLELGLFGTLVLPLLESEVGPANSEAPAQTQSILAAALQARERAGSCKPLARKAGPTPGLELSCLSTPDQKCTPSEVLDEGGGEGRYSLTAWTEDPLWAAIGYKPRAELGHRAHYSLEIAASGRQCEIVVEALVEVRPGKYLRYRRAAEVDADGATTLVPLQIVDPAD